jgi:hypothetical protein
MRVQTITSIRNRMHWAYVARRMHEKLERHFPIGCKVRLTAEAAKRWPRYKDSTGTVTKYEAGVSPLVLWEGRKTPSGYNPRFLRRVRSKRRSR